MEGGNPQGNSHGRVVSVHGDCQGVRVQARLELDLFVSHNLASTAYLLLPMKILPDESVCQLVYRLVWSSTLRFALFCTNPWRRPMQLALKLSKVVFPSRDGAFRVDVFTQSRTLFQCAFSSNPSSQKRNGTTKLALAYLLFL